MSRDLLTTCLLDLWVALGPAAERVLLGGGYGLYLKQQHASRMKEPTLIPADLWPIPRDTQDLDLLLTAEMVADASAMHVVRRVLDQLGYRPVEGCEYLQFVLEFSALREVKVDLLTTQFAIIRTMPGIEADDRRARPAARDRPLLHAHPTDGAIDLDESALSLAVAGTLTTGGQATVKIRVPHPFTYLLMKLTAYRDRKHDPEKDLGRHHALDVFRIVAMLTEPEFADVVTRIGRHANDAQVQSCRDVVARDFTTPTSPGVLAARHHQLWHNDDDLEKFLGAMRELFSE